MSTGSAAFATTHGVIDRVHNHAAVARTTAEPARAAGLTGAFERVFAIAHDADGCSAGGKDFASFARRKFDNSIVALARHYLCEGAGAASDECALAGTELDVVYQRTYRYLTQRQAVAYFGSHVFAGNHGGADFEAVGRDDVRFGTVDVIQQGDACRAVGVVLDALDYGGYAVFVSLKVYDTVLAFVATPRYREVRWPSALRPPLARLPTVRDFSGVVAVMVPLNTPITLCRCPGVVGLNFLTAILC